MHGPHLQSSAQLAAPGGRKGSPPFPHTFRSLHHVPIGHPSNPSTPHLFCGRKSPGTTIPFSAAKPASSTMQVGNITILLLQGPELPWKRLSCPGSKGGIPILTPGRWSWWSTYLRVGLDSISGLTMAHPALPHPPSSTTRNSSGGKRPPGSPSWDINATWWH